MTLLDAAGVDFTYLGNVENCCGTPMLVAGKWEIFAENMKKNIAAVKAAGADTVIASCPACDMMWRQVYPEWAKKLGIEYGITAKHYSELVSDKIKAGKFKFPNPIKKRVTWHDSCHIGRVSGVYEQPRDVIKAIPGVEFVEMTHHHEEAHCCGSVLTLIKDPLVAHDIGETRLDEATAVERRDRPRPLPLLRVPAPRDEGEEKLAGRNPRPGRLRLRIAGQKIRRPEPGSVQAVEGLRGHDRAHDPPGLRRPDGYDVARAA